MKRLLRVSRLVFCSLLIQTLCLASPCFTEPVKASVAVQIDYPEGANRSKPKSVGLSDVFALLDPRGLHRYDARYKDERIPTSTNPQHP